MTESQPSIMVSLTRRDGSSMQVEVYPSYPHKPKAIQNLTASLPELLTEFDMPIEPIRLYSTSGWDLDESGDTIHRYVELSSKQDETLIREQIRTASRELNHDPHLHVDETFMTISCTTHVPPGLSMKDVKLAGKINEILNNMDLFEGTSGHTEADILTQRPKR